MKRWHRPARHCALATLLALVAFAGCEKDEEDPLENCDLAHTGRALEGRWLLTAHGQRKLCSDESFNGRLKIETPDPLEVRVVRSERDANVFGRNPETVADSFVDRIERADFVLELDEDNPARIDLEGYAGGSCVVFNLTEELQNGDLLDYRFEGFIASESSAEGNFRGDGPGDCSVHGKFELVVK
ncbi:MAG: hypothetical protein OEZ06_04970 [Myxococcales bacterium]|nr:hypothetical protein [Myxococcales bacterium]